MNQDPFDIVIAALAAAQCNPRKGAKGNMDARCPAHEDKRASLSVKRGDDGKVIVFCHAGCTAMEIRKSLGLTMEEFGYEPQRQPENDRERKVYKTAADAIAGYHWLGKPSKLWPYHDVNGSPVGVVCRWDKGNEKTIRPVSRTAEGWVMEGMPAPRPLYRLPLVRGLGKNARVFVCEGEKASDAIMALGLVCTTSAHGAKNAHHTDWSPLAGKIVYLLPDNDDPGRAYMEEVMGLIKGKAAEIHWVDLRLPEEHDDTHDMLYRECKGDCQEAMRWLAESIAEAQEVGT